MSTSGVNVFTMSAQEMVTLALRKAKVLKNDSPRPAAKHLDTGLQELNMLIKSYQTDGLQLWARERATLFLALDTNEYNLGPSGDNATLSYVETALGADAVTSATSLTVDSITGISNGDYIGIILDDGSLHWDTVNGAPSGTTVTLTTGLASAASEDTPVYAYTTKIARPLRIIEMFRRDSDNKDVSLNINSLSEYSEQNDKLTDSTVLDAVYNPQLTNGILYLWPQPDDLTVSIEFWFHRPFDIFVNLTDTADFPSEWYKALVYGLADLLADTYSDDIQHRSMLHKRALEYHTIVSAWDSEDVGIQLEPEPHWNN